MLPRLEMDFASESTTFAFEKDESFVRRGLTKGFALVVALLLSPPPKAKPEDCEPPRPEADNPCFDALALVCS